MSTTIPKEVRAAEERYARGEITKQALSAMRKRHGVQAPPMGRPPARARELKENERGNVVVTVVLPARPSERLTRLADERNVRNRALLAGEACVAGFAEMVADPPAKHEPPGGAMRQQGDSGVKVELRPADLARIERYAAEREAARNVVVAMALVRGLALLGRRA